MAYTPINFQDLPSTSTPVSAENLNHVQTQYQAAVDDSVPRVTTANRVYATTAAGEPTTFAVSSSATSGAVVQRSGTQVVVPATPTATTHATSKSYVDGAVSGAQDATKAGYVSVAPTGEFVMIGGSYRRIDATTWAAIADSGHEPLNTSTPTIVSSNRLRIPYTFTASKVISVSVTVDEAFAGAGSGGVRVGASVGLTYLDVYFYIGTSSTPVDPGALSTAGANIWVQGLFRV